MRIFTPFMDITGEEAGGSAGISEGNHETKVTSEPSPYGNYPGDDDPAAMFDMLEEYLRKDEPTQSQAAKDYQEPEGTGEKKREEQEEQEDQEPLEGEKQEPKEGEFKPIKVKVGDNEYQVKSKEQVQKLVERSQLASELYQEHQKISAEYKELDEDMKYLENLSQENPAEFMDTLAEQIPEEALVEWMRSRIKYMKMSDEERAQHEEYKKAKEAMKREEVLKQKLEEVRQKEARIKQQQEVSQLKNIQNSLENKYSEVVGKDWFDRVVKLQIQEAARLQGKGEQVSLSRFKSMIEAVVEPVYKKLKPGHKPLKNLRSSTSPGNVNQKASVDPSTESGFDALLKAIQDGRV